MSYKNQFSSSWAGIIVMFAFLGALLFGYVANIVDIVNSSFDPLTPLLILRFIGILFFPLGWILGVFF